MLQNPEIPAGNQRLYRLPICEACWITERSRWEIESIDENGRVRSRLVDIDIPMDVELGTINICCLCGDITIVGLHIKHSLDGATHIDPDYLPKVNDDDISTWLEDDENNLG
jgi:hypothetical protein